MVLLEQNDELVKKIESARRQLEDEELKARIFEEKVNRNSNEIMGLRRKK
jgi:hypothetical protein